MGGNNKLGHFSIFSFFRRAPKPPAEEPEIPLEVPEKPINILRKHALVDKHVTKCDQLEKIQKDIERLQRITNTLRENFRTATSACCFCHRFMMVRETLDDLSDTVREYISHKDDEQAEGSDHGESKFDALKERCRQFSITEEALRRQEQRYFNLNVDDLRLDLKRLERETERVKLKAYDARQRLIRLQIQYEQESDAYVFFWSKYAFWKSIILDAIE